MKIQIKPVDSVVPLRVLPWTAISLFLHSILTTTGRSMATKQQNLCLSSMRAFLRACFSVSSSRRYLSLTSCMALSNCGWISPRPWKQNQHTAELKQFIHYSSSLTDQPTRKHKRGTKTNLNTLHDRTNSFPPLRSNRNRFILQLHAGLINNRMNKCRDSIIAQHLKALISGFGLNP